MTLPYANATSGQKATDDIRRTLQAFGCSKFAPMEDFAEGTITIQFEYRGRMVQVTASAKGWASAYLRMNPHTHRHRKSKVDYEREALKQGQIAVWSILRDWIKGQITAVETGILAFDSAFLGQILLPSGNTVHQEVEARGFLPMLEDKRNG
jgi:hypothetical protein